MADAAIEVEQHPCSTVVDDGRLDRFTRERSDGIERRPPGDDGNLDTIIDVRMQQRRPFEAGDRVQLRHDRGLEVAAVLGRALRRRARLPDARDHFGPATTFQGTTRQRVTRPSVTYGSARAKRSTTSALSVLNTINAPSGGVPSAPAITISPRPCASLIFERCAGRCGIRFSAKPSTTSYIRAK